MLFLRHAQHLEESEENPMCSQVCLGQLIHVQFMFKQ